MYHVLWWYTQLYLCTADCCDKCSHERHVCTSIRFDSVVKFWSSSAAYIFVDEVKVQEQIKCMLRHEAAEHYMLVWSPRFV